MASFPPQLKDAEASHLLILLSRTTSCWRLVEPGSQLTVLLFYSQHGIVAIALSIQPYSAHLDPEEGATTTPQQPCTML